MRRWFLIVVVLAVVAAPAAASDLGFYAGAGFGVTSLDIRDFNPDYAHLRFEEDAFGHKFFGGYRFLKFFAVEAGYTNFGEVLNYEGGNFNFYRESKVEPSMWSGYAVGLLPVSGKVDFFGKLGYASWNVDNHVSDSGVTEDRSTSGSDIAWGLGMNFRFKKLGARFEADWLEVSDAGSVVLFSASLMYNF